MNGFVLVIFSFILGTTMGGMPPELRMLLGLREKQDDVSSMEEELKEELKSDPATLLGYTDFNGIDHVSHSKYNEADRKTVDDGNVDESMPTSIGIVECYVEFQVTRRIPGQCTRLNGAMPACQAEDYMSINYSDCS